MKTVIKSYPIVCPSCGGRGYISNPENMTTEATIPCPACEGKKTVIVNEITES